MDIIPPYRCRYKDPYSDGILIIICCLVPYEDIVSLNGMDFSQLDACVLTHAIYIKTKVCTKSGKTDTIKNSPSDSSKGTSFSSLSKLGVKPYKDPIKSRELIRKD